ncbi:MAG: PEGA domain-containing protein [Deltaproteobacteria bacterium]|nr:PEGA domain-containing protein [Deltaproteobacteria bacterium]
MVAALFIASPSLPAQQLDREARRLFEEGVALLQDGRFSDALGRFERARTFREVPAVMLNLALAQRGVGRYVDASRSLERYVELARGRLDQSRQAEVTRLRAEIEAALASLTVRVAGMPSEVFLDGRVLSETQRGVPIAVDPGPHVVRLSGEAIEAEEVARTLAMGQSLELSLVARARDARSRLMIEAAVDATVAVDHRLVGRGSQEVLAAPGAHDVEVRREGFEVFRAMVTARPRRDQRVLVTMQRTPSSGSILGRWWFWTIMGAVAAGATAVVVYATQAPPPAETGTLGYAVGAQAVW